MSFGQVFGSALQGIGAGMMAQTQANQSAAAEQAKETAAMRREIALENLRNQNAIGRDKAQSENRKSEMEFGAKADDWKSSREVARRTQSDITMAQAKGKIDEKLKRLESTLKISEDTKAWLRDVWSKAYDMNMEVGETKEGADGSVIVFSKAGSIIAQTKPGMVAPKNAGGASLDAFPGAPSGMPGAPAPAPTNRPPLNSFDR